MGKVYYDMGFLAKAEVVECSATDLIGSYVGHTGPKVQKVLENALGRVLFVDEAYRLADGHFAKEAMDEIVDCLTKPKYAQKLIIILAGYDEDINRLMAQNPGLTSRFPDVIVFDGLKPTDCLDLLIELLSGRQHEMSKKKKDLDLSALESSTPDFKQQTLNQFETLSKIANWANARDVQTIAKHIFGLLLKSGAMKAPVVFVTEDNVRSALKSMISERSQRQKAGNNKPKYHYKDGMAQMQNVQAPPPPPNAAMSSSAASKPQPELPLPLAEEMPPASDVMRDDGVSDVVWEQLQRDKQAAKQKEERYQKLLEATTDTTSNIKTLQQKEQASEREFQRAIKLDKDQAALQEAKQLREEARLRHESERRAQEELLEELERKRKAEEEERRKEVKVQQKLKTLGVCSAGYRWIKQSGGYRCEAGYHFVTDSQLGL
jgi:hypothetical protein